MITANDRQPIISYSCLVASTALFRFVFTILATKKRVFEVKVVSATSSARTATLTSGFDFLLAFNNNHCPKLNTLFLSYGHGTDRQRNKSQYR